MSIDRMANEQKIHEAFNWHAECATSSKNRLYNIRCSKKRTAIQHSTSCQFDQFMKKQISNFNNVCHMVGYGMPIDWFI